MSCVPAAVRFREDYRDVMGTEAWEGWGLLVKVQIIGVGDDGLEGLTAAARDVVTHAAYVIGPRKVLEHLPRTLPAQRITIESDLELLVREIRGCGDKPTVLLSPGDPLFYGTARYVCERIGKEHFDVVPHVSSMQLAFARVKESWDEAYLANLATTPTDRVLERIRTAPRAGLFTTEEATPNEIAQRLLNLGVDYFYAYVCENLGAPDERVTQGELADIARQTFASLNVLILVRKPDLPDRPVELIGRRIFGNPDERFLQSRPKRGLLTPSDVRVLALAELDLGPRSIMWDVGAGSGSVAIEAASIAVHGEVYAIEVDPEDHQLIVSNADRFGVRNLVPVLGAAPDAWANLPTPDAIFVGGTGRSISRIVSLAFAQLRPVGRIVANVSSVDNLADVHRALRECGSHEVSVRMINIAQATHQLEQVRFEACNPSFLLSTVKPPVP